MDMFLCFCKTIKDTILILLLRSNLIVLRLQLLIMNFSSLLQAFQIANLIREYTEVMNSVTEELAKGSLANGTTGGAGMSPLPLPPPPAIIHQPQPHHPQPPQHAQQLQQIQMQATQQKQTATATGTGPRPPSMHFRPSSTALVAPQPS